jgi:predicted TIM-barrel fold metal-dependent hydrolase
MIIDGHAHLGGEYKDLPTILSTLDKLGIDRVILCPTDQTRHKPLPVPNLASKFPAKELNFAVNRLIRAATPQVQHQRNIDKGNKNVFNVSVLSGGRIIQFFWANPLKEGIMYEMETKFQEWKFRGIKLHQACHSFKIISSQFRNLAEFAVTQKIPVFIHFYSKKEILDFISISAEYKTPFIVGHLIGLELFIQNKTKICDNIYFDISCPALVSIDRIKKAIKEFGSGRIIMGSDAPYGKKNVKEIVSRIISLSLPDNECEMILGNNLNSILMT